MAHYPFVHRTSCPSYILCILLSFALSGCTTSAVRQAEAVTAQADSLWRAGKMYGVDEGDSASLAQAYQTLKKHSVFSIPFIAPSPWERAGGEVCYHYGRLLRAKDNPIAAMEVFIDATHTRTHDYHILGRVYSNIGDICHLAGDFPLSYDMFSRSADCFLRNGDTLLYCYGLNNMAFELAEQGKEKETLILLDSITYQYQDRNILSKTLETKALLYQSLKCYDSVVTIVDSLQSIGYNDVIGFTMKARAFYNLNCSDSALFYANSVVQNSPTDACAIAAYYILSHNNDIINADSVLTLTSARADAQKAWAYSQSKLAQAVQLLEQDLTRKPDWKWLFAIVATILVISLCLSVYIFRKRRQHKLLSQQVNEQAMANAIIKQQHKQLEQEYAHYKQNKIEQIEQNSAILVQAEDFPENIHWKDYNAMCEIIDDDLGKLTIKLQTIYHLSEREIRLCVLVLLGISNSEQLAAMLLYGSSGIRNFKNRTAKKLGTNSIELRKILLNIAVGEIQKTDK